MSHDSALPAAPASAPSHSSRIHGCLLGGALGESLGYALQSSAGTTSGVLNGGGLRDITALPGGSSISDATQLTLYTVDGLLEALEWANSGVAADTNACLWLAYLRWLATQKVPLPEAAPFQPPRWIDSHAVLQHPRTPDEACLSGLGTGSMGTYFRPVNPEAKSSGTVMRSAPFGLIPYIDAADVYKLSADAAALTHGHPAARQGAGVFSLMIHALVSGHGLRSAAEYALDQVGAGMLRKDETLIPDLVAKSRTALRLSAAGPLLDPGHLARELGGGQAAEEALAVALYSVLATEPDRAAGTVDPEEHFRAAVAVALSHGGDSGSTASMTGNLLGAYYGESCLPAQWLGTLEAADVIAGMAFRLAEVTGA